MLSRIVFFILIVVFLSCEKDETCDTTPKFTNLEASEISYSKFTISGEIKTNDCDNTMVKKDWFF